MRRGRGARWLARAAAVARRLLARAALPAPPRDRAARPAYKERRLGARQPRGQRPARARGGACSGIRSSTRLEAQVSDANQSLKAALARLSRHARRRASRAPAGFRPLTAQRERHARGETSVYQCDRTFPAAARIATATTSSPAAICPTRWTCSVASATRWPAPAPASRRAPAIWRRSISALHAELATDYFTLRGLDAQQQLLDRTVADYAQALQLTENLYTGGAAAHLRRAAGAGATRDRAHPGRGHPPAPRPDRARHRRAGRQRGQQLSAVERPLPASMSRHARRGDPGVPSQLLERRPDVAAAERRVAAANAGIGVARAAYFPVLQPARPPPAGRASRPVATGSARRARYWSLGPQALLTVFDGGLHAAQSAAGARALRSSRSPTTAAPCSPRSRTWRTTSRRCASCERESVSEAAAVDSHAGRARSGQLRYKGGIVTYLEVVSTENAALAARLAAADIETAAPQPPCCW